MTLSKQSVQLYYRLSISAVFLGALFTLMRWPYGRLIIVVGAIGMVIFYAIKFYRKQNKILLDYARLLLIISFLFHYTFRILHLQYGYIFTFITQGALVVFLILYIRNILFPSEENAPSEATAVSSSIKKLNYLLYGFAIICIIVGAYFKVLHWKFGFITGNVLLSFGLLTALISVYLGPKDPES